MNNQDTMNGDLLPGDRLDPSGYVQRASRQYGTKAILLTWTAISSASILAFYYSSQFWSGALLLIAGVLITFAIGRRSGRRGRRLQPVPNLSAASKCVWQMDREG